MNRTPLSRREDHAQLHKFAEAIKTRRYFRKIHPNLLLEMLRQGALVQLKQDDHLIREGDTTPPEMYILLEGALVVMSQGEFILRLESPGDVVGELSIISPEPRAADVIAEVDSKVIVFPYEMFQVTDDATHVSVVYLTFAHILAEKLRITTAQSMLRKTVRTNTTMEPPKIAIVDVNSMERRVIRGALSTLWTEMNVVEYTSPQEFIDNPLQHKFNLIIIDPLYNHSFASDDDLLNTLGEALGVHGCSVLAISAWCNDESNREMLASIGVQDFLGKPYSSFDLKHRLSAFKVSYYREKELEQVEHAADTDRLTNLANRRRMEEFLDALVTLYPEEKQPFSLVIADVDNFKFYNDTHGHQMGDVVLATIAGIFKKSVRRGDLAARYGGEEFVVILPKCDKQAAMNIASKLRQTVEEEVVPYQEQQPLGNLTATFGVSTYPDDADNVEDLLKRADECLYRGKEAGRNIVIGAKPIEEPAKDA
jgi:diguanylate cyclase (GGDEF)-like protein